MPVPAAFAWDTAGGERRSGAVQRAAGTAFLRAGGQLPGGADVPRVPAESLRAADEFGTGGTAIRPQLWNRARVPGFHRHRPGLAASGVRAARGAGLRV